ncbi:hypothetical protein BASA61_009619 [Batrachochytrium salamandrivorans]|nr:hypothetical protein BASA61_009619 [Batrachochytrium salamandrivorans]
MVESISASRCWKDAAFAYSSGKHELALSFFQQQQGDSSALLLSRAFVLSSLGMHAKSVKIAAQVIARADDLTPMALYHKGITNVKLGRVAEAVVDLTKIVGFVQAPSTKINIQGLSFPWALHICDVLFNLALVLFQIGQIEYSGSMLEAAMHSIETVPQQNAVARVIVYGFQDAKLFEIPPNLLFAPPHNIYELHFERPSQRAKLHSPYNTDHSTPSQTEMSDDNRSEFDEALDVLSVYRHSIAQLSLDNHRWSSSQNDDTKDRHSSVSISLRQENSQPHHTKAYPSSLEPNNPKIFNPSATVATNSSPPLAIPPRAQSRIYGHSLGKSSQLHNTTHSGSMGRHHLHSTGIPSVETQSRNHSLSPTPRSKIIPSTSALGGFEHYRHGNSPTTRTNSTLHNEQTYQGNLVDNHHLSLSSVPAAHLADSDFQGELYVMMGDYGAWILRWCIVRGSQLFITTSKHRPTVLTTISLNAIQIEPNPERSHSRSGYSFHISYASGHQMLTLCLSTEALPLLLRWITFLLKASQGIQHRPMPLVPIQNRRLELGRVPLMEHHNYQKVNTKPLSVHETLHNTLTHWQEARADRKRTVSVPTETTIPLLESLGMLAPPIPAIIATQKTRPVAGPKNPARRTSHRRSGSDVSVKPNSILRETAAAMYTTSRSDCAQSSHRVPGSVTLALSNVDSMNELDPHSTTLSILEMLEL